MVKISFGEKSSKYPHRKHNCSIIIRISNVIHFSGRDFNSVLRYELRSARTQGLSIRWTSDFFEYFLRNRSDFPTSLNSDMTLWPPKIIPVHFGLNTEIQTATQTEYFGSRWTFEFYRKTGRSSPILSSLCIQDRYHPLIAVRWKVPTFLAWTIILYCFPVCVILSKFRSKNCSEWSETLPEIIFLPRNLHRRVRFLVFLNGIRTRIELQFFLLQGEDNLHTCGDFEDFSTNDIFTME